MKSVKYLMSYILVACLGLWLAFFASMKFMAPAHSQDAPTAGDLPPEFLQEVEKTQVPPAGTPTPAPTSTPGAPSGVPSDLPPPPPEATPAAPTPGMQEEPAMEATAPQPPASPQPEQGGYVYDPTGKRDPFKPFKEFRASKDGDRKKEILEPLQRWDLERLQIVGILWDVKTPRAMIKDPDGAVYTVVKNSKIGRNEGFVTAIREGELVILETRYVDGVPNKETRVLEFKK